MSDPRTPDDPASGVPAGIDLPRHSRMDGRGGGIWLRRGGVAVLALFCLAGLLNVFGQQPRTGEAAGAAAELRVQAPQRLRGGLIGEVVVEVTARRRIGDPRIVLAEGLVDGITINSTVPQPEAEEDGDGALVLAYGPIGTGETLRVRLHYQVNPTTVGGARQDVEVRDGDEVLAAVRRRMFVFP